MFILANSANSTGSHQVDLTVDDRLSHLLRTNEGLLIGLGLNRSRLLELGVEHASK